ncbi:hypothetical protein OC846_003259 [Tilletia horrida]|uniref:Dihydrofolate reductase n=1 Tax=Tilletia horrida TaxID=155126 RepID=A0AAN6GSG6_9BASI|nr:hypothetical protein OC845_004197 [Tilletia horrida]KAK0551481.1 hypothetical protein OC846_003259 [Tilletia horrida]KAK0566521.1 hypothetical protein OC861_003211 [Tilletia horrida]
MSTTSSRLSLTLVVAVSPNNGIGAGGGLPWRLSREMAYFKHVTSAVQPAHPQEHAKNAVVMGKNTWMSIPPRFRPLAGRINVVISRTASKEELGIDAEQDAHLFASPSAALAYLQQRRSSESPTPISRIFLMGGAQLYTQALQAAADPRSSSSPTSDEWNLDRLLITRIKQPEFPQCDVFLPEFRIQEQISSSDSASGSSQAKPLDHKVWEQASDEELSAYVGPFDIPGLSSLEGPQEEKGVTYTFEMWTRV